MSFGETLGVATLGGLVGGVVFDGIWCQLQSFSFPSCSELATARLSVSRGPSGLGWLGRWASKSEGCLPQRAFLALAFPVRPCQLRSPLVPAADRPARSAPEFSRA